jgi:hypothetical protein
LDSIQDVMLYNREKYFIGKGQKEIIGDVYYADNEVRRSGNLIHLQGKGGILKGYFFFI